MEHLRALFSTYSSSLKNCYLWAKSYIAVESLKFLKMNSYNSWYYVSFYPFLQLFLKESSQSNYTNFNINNIARIRTSLSLADAETSLQATVSSRSDFCNVMLPGPLASSKRLEDSSLKLSPHCINLTPFHGLPFLVGSDFEALLMTYKLVNGLSPFVLYLSDLIIPYTQQVLFTLRIQGFTQSLELERSQRAAGPFLMCLFSLV